jgi:hypothetical protein
MFDRIRRGWALTKKAWAVVRSHPRLVRLPITGGAIAVLVTLVVMLLGGAIAVGGFFLVTAGTAAAEALGVVLIVVGMLVGIAAAVFLGATKGVFGVALYRYVADGAAVGPFTAADLDGAARAGR